MRPVRDLKVSTLLIAVSQMSPGPTAGSREHPIGMFGQTSLRLGIGQSFDPLRQRCRSGGGGVDGGWGHTLNGVVRVTL